MTKLFTIVTEKKQKKRSSEINYILSTIILKVSNLMISTQSNMFTFLINLPVCFNTVLLDLHFSSRISLEIKMNASNPRYQDIFSKLYQPVTYRLMRRGVKTNEQQQSRNSCIIVRLTKRQKITNLHCKYEIKKINPENSLKIGFTLLCGQNKVDIIFQIA